MEVLCRLPLKETGTGPIMRRMETETNASPLAIRDTSGRSRADWHRRGRRTQRVLRRRYNGRPPLGKRQMPVPPAQPWASIAHGHFAPLYSSLPLMGLQKLSHAPKEHTLFISFLCLCVNSARDYPSLTVFI
jgi:hypothetical protein